MGNVKKTVLAGIAGVFVVILVFAMLAFIFLAGMFASNQQARKDISENTRSCVQGAPKGGDGRYVVPMAGVITSPYGRRDNPLGTGGDADDALNFHRGVDLAGVP